MLNHWMLRKRDIDMVPILITLNIIFFLWCLSSWVTVWRLKGGSGHGRWSEEYGGYLHEARESRRVVTFIFVCSIALTILTLT